MRKQDDERWDLFSMTRHESREDTGKMLGERDGQNWGYTEPYGTSVWEMRGDFGVWGF